MNEKVLFIHVHIVKCGGTTFQEILKRNFTRPRAYYRENPIILHDHTASDIERTIAMAPWLEALSSHHVSLDLPFYLEKPQIIAISFVRDPVDRFISHYFFHHTKEQALQTVPVAKELNLREYIEYGLVNGNAKPYKNGQIWHLTRLNDETGIEKVQNSIKSKHLLLFPTSRFDEACVVLEKLYPDHFKDCSYEIENVGIKNQEITKDDILLIKNNINSNDYKLVEISDLFLDNLKKELFQNDIEFQKVLDAFHLRCKKYKKSKSHKTNEKIKKAIGYILPLRIKNFIKQCL